MKISLNTLNDLIDLKDIDIKDIEKETYLKIMELGECKKLVDCTNLVIGKVISCIPHPNSDHLHKCKVDVGNEVLDIICGAPNCVNNIKVITALVGSKLPGITIKQSKIRGEVSNGMLCSLSELGIESKYQSDEEKEGIYILPDDAPLGSNPLNYLHLDDYIIDLDLTPNRGDLLSCKGYAYDLGVIFNKKVNLNIPKITESDNLNNIEVIINTDKNVKYSCRVIKNIKVKESPIWLKSRLIASGIRPINNIVDITNYVMIFLGQPLHAFDLNKLNSNKIIVRDAKDNEEIITLDNNKQKLNKDDLLITDNNTPIAIAGVMGGLNSQIDDNTKDIVLEAAYFDPISIRKTSKKLNLRSDSSIRFEKTIDVNLQEDALNLASYLVKQLSNKEAIIYKNINTLSNFKKDDIIINHNFDNIRNTLGINISNEDILNILTKLEFPVIIKDNNNFEVSIPSRRPDISQRQDINEEILRFYGYDNVENKLPLFSVPNGYNLFQKRINLIKDYFTDNGFNEVITYSLLNKNEINKYNLIKEEAIKIANPLSLDREYLRLSLINNLLEVFKYNNNRGINDIFIYEVGKVFNSNQDTYLSGLLNGNYNQNNWNNPRKIDFYLVKGLIDTLFDKFDIKFDYELLNLDSYHPYKSAKLIYNNKEVGLIGYLNPKNNLNEYKDLCLFEINLSLLLNKKPNIIKFEELNKYPKIERDLTFVVDKNLDSIILVNKIKEIGKKLLSNIEIFDVYYDDKLQNQKSISLTLTFEDKTKTLEKKDVDNIINKILNKLEEQDIKLK